MLTKEQLALTKEQFMHTNSPYDFLVNFLGYTWLNLTNLLINLLGSSRLNLGLFLCEGTLASVMIDINCEIQLSQGFF